MPPIRRTIKNVVHNYSEAQVKVRESTSNDPWGPSSTIMGEIADLTYNVVAFTEIMQMIWKRLNDHGKNWRHVYKSLVLLDYIIKTGSEKVAQQCKENIYAIQTLKDFQHIEDNKDLGMNVREKAKQLVSLLKDEERLKNERVKALKAKERFAQNAMGIGNEKQQTRYGAGSPSLQTSSGGYSDPYGGAGAGAGAGSSDASPETELPTGKEVEYARPSSVGEEEIQLQLALAMSKEEHDEQLRKQKSDDIKLQLAIDESKKHAQVEVKPGGGLLDLDSPQSPPKDPWGAPPPQKAPTDPWGAPLPAQPSAAASMPQAEASDPWGSPARAPPQPTPSTDPWGTPLGASPAASMPSSQPAPSPQPDPWSSGAPTAAPPQPPRQSSPWGGPPPAQTSPAPGAAGFDSSFGSSPVPPPVTNGTNNVDDAFDLIGSRSAGSSPAKQPNQNKPVDAFDPLGGGSPSGDLWDMNGINDALPDKQQQQLKHRKTPQDFLGENAALVNLDQLVPKNTNTDTNPFATASSTNPFEQQQQQQTTNRVTLNQLQSTSYNTGFTQPTSSVLLPAPLVPMNNPPPMQPQQQGYNPFL